MFVEQHYEGCGEAVRFTVPNSRDGLIDTIMRHVREN